MYVYVCVFLEYVPEKDLRPAVYSTYWVLFTISVDGAIAISSIYWGLVYDSRVHTFDTLNVFMHIVNAALMLFDLLIVAQPMRILHCYWPFGFALVYILFNVVYYAAGGTDK